MKKIVVIFCLIGIFFVLFISNSVMSQPRGFTLSFDDIDDYVMMEDPESFSITGENMLQDSSNTGITLAQDQSQDAQPLSEFVEEWYIIIDIKQPPGGEHYITAYEKIILKDSTTISTERLDFLKFILEYDPLLEKYLFTYSFRNPSTSRLLFLVDRIELIHSKEEGFTGTATTDESKINFDVMIKFFKDKFVCNIVAQEGSEKHFEHKLSFKKLSKTNK